MKYSYWTDLQGLQFAEDEDTKWLQAMPFGKFKHPIHGTLEMNPDKLSRMAANVKNHVRGQDLDIDYDHKADPAKGSKAAGWVQDVEVRQDGLYLAVKFTPEAKAAIQAGEYRYFSPEYHDKWSDPRGGEHSDVLFGGALTNRPFLKGILPINLSELSREEEGQVDEFLKSLRDSLGLPETATEEQILEAASAKPEPVTEPPKGEEVTEPEVKPEGEPVKEPVMANETVKRLTETLEVQGAEITGLKKQLAEAAVTTKLTEWSAGASEGAKYMLPVSLHEDAKAIMLGEEGADFTQFIETLLKTGVVELGERGRTRAGNPEGKSATEQFVEKVAAIQLSDKIDYVDAVTKVASDNPELFEDYRDEAINGTAEVK